MSHRSKQLVCIVSLVLATFLLAGCPPRESIAKVKMDPGRYAGREISIAGRVTDAFGAMGHGAFEVDDGTGRIWVVTGTGVPETGAKLAVVGHVEQGVAIAGRNFAVILRETERRH